MIKRQKVFEAGTLRRLRAKLDLRASLLGFVCAFEEKKIQGHFSVSCLTAVVDSFSKRPIRLRYNVVVLCYKYIFVGT